MNALQGDPDAGRTAFSERSWGRAFERLWAADAHASLEPYDLELLAVSAYLTGRDPESDVAWMRAHDGYIRLGNNARAASCAFWQATCLLFRGDAPPAMAWIERGRRLVDEGALEGAPRGWLQTLTALPILFGGDAGRARPHFDEALEIATRFADEDLSALARLGLAQAMVLEQHGAEALTLLDEIMVALPSERWSPIIVGLAFCQAIDIGQQLFDLRRARDWTASLSRWCEAQPDLVPYRGNCLIHRCEIFQLGGAWGEALDAAKSACEWLSGPSYWDSLGSAYYQLGEIQRLRGAFEQAEEAYRNASRAGRDPEPGMSLLRLAQGTPAAAGAAVRRALDEAHHPAARSKLLPAYVEIMIATRDLDAADAGAKELVRIAGDVDAPYLSGLAVHATGSVLLAGGDARGALPHLRAAYAAWRRLDVPYQAARVREAIGMACRALDDHASADLELDAAKAAYGELGAAPDLARLERRSIMSRPGAGGLTAREIEVLTLVASGKSNRAIAGVLVISEKTVARHLSNIFTKLGLASRAEATAYAYENGLV